MLKFLKFIGIVLLLGILFLLVSGLFISKAYHFERSITINAPQEEIWKNISRFSNLEKWDPWKIKDPKMKRAISGTDGTVGATYTWDGNDEVGSGSQTYLSLSPLNNIRIALHFKEPFENTATVFYQLDQAPKGVKVTWGFDSKFKYPMNALAFFFADLDENMDKDFSAGLANLKKLCESNTNLTALK